MRNFVSFESPFLVQKTCHFLDRHLARHGRNPSILREKISREEGGFDFMADLLEHGVDTYRHLFVIA